MKKQETTRKETFSLTRLGVAAEVRSLEGVWVVFTQKSRGGVGEEGLLITPAHWDNVEKLSAPLWIGRYYKSSSLALLARRARYGPLKEAHFDYFCGPNV